MFKKGALTFLFLSVLSTPALAQQSSADKLYNRIETLERQLDGISQKLSPATVNGSPVIIGQGDAAVANLEPRIANLEVHFSELNKKFKNMRLDIIELKKENAELRERVSNLLEDIVKEVEKQNALTENKQLFEAKPKAPVSPEIQEKQLTAVLTKNTFEEELTERISKGNLTPEKSYQIAFGFIEQAQYPKAVKAFATFIREFGDHPLASNAYYWLGEAYYAQKEYRLASAQFLKGYNIFPQGRKAPDNLLKLGMSLGQIDEIPDACLTFQKLESEFKNSPAAIKQRLELEKYRFKCP